MSVMAEEGWYRDPDRRRTLRFWDGTHWTEARKPAPSLRPWLILLLVVLLVVSAAIAFWVFFTYHPCGLTLGDCGSD